MCAATTRPPQQLQVPSLEGRVSRDVGSLLVRAGMVHKLAAGIFSLLPLGVRVLDRLTAAVSLSMERDLGAERVVLPMLQPGSLWEQTGRWDEAGPELFRVRDRRDRPFCLAPTAEEAVTAMYAATGAGQAGQSAHPLRVYQVGTKFRDEARPRQGLVRGREFVMKDLYTFDGTAAAARETYAGVLDAYRRLFVDQLQLPVLVSAADPGLIGGSLSHELVLDLQRGADNDERACVAVCAHCDHVESLEQELAVSQGPETGCSSCGTLGVDLRPGLEVGHAFVLDQKYTSVFSAANQAPAFMGCYGIGMTRLLAAAVESGADDLGIRWPTSLAPYAAAVVVASPKNQRVREKAEQLATMLQGEAARASSTIEKTASTPVVLDDRPASMDWKSKVAEAQLLGYPLIVVVGRDALKETGATVDVFQRRPTMTSNAPTTVPIQECVKYL